MKSKHLAVAISAILGAAAGLVSPLGMAAEEKENEKPKAYELEEIVVTAQKHQAELKDAPISVTEFNAEQRNLTGTNTAAQMLALTPGVTLTDYGVAIRGIGRGQPTTSLGSADPVAYYVNGFYLPDYNVIGENTLVGGNVQILRGPQGTLYGTNAIGGASNLISRVPTNDFRAETLVGVGKYKWYTAGATVSGPISDDYRVRVSAQKFAQSDFVQKNLGPVEAGFKFNNIYVEAQLDGNVTDDFHFLLRSSTFKFNNTPGYTAPVRYATRTTYTSGFDGNIYTDYTKSPPSQPRVIDVNIRGEDRLYHNQVHILNADWNLGPVTLYYVGGYQAYKADGYSDSDSTPRTGFVTDPAKAAAATPYGIAAGVFISTSVTANYFSDNSRYSHELRLEGNSFDQLEWNLGLYYSNADYDQSFWYAFPGQYQLANPVYRFYNGAVQAAPIQPNPKYATYTQRNILDDKSSAAFGQATYTLTDDLKLTAGARYSKYERSASTEFHNFYWDTFSTGDTTPLVNRAFPKDESTAVTGRVAVDYQMTDSINMYFSAARGYKPASFSLDNILPDPALGGRNNISEEEHLNAYELGFKHDLTGTLYTTAALFFNDYMDLQIPATVVRLDPAPGGGTTRTQGLFYDNADAEIYGLELESTWTPATNVWLRANYTYTHSKYTAFQGTLLDLIDLVNYPNGKSILGNEMARTPQHKASAAGFYTFNFTPGSLILGGNVAYNGQMYSNYFAYDAYRVPGYTVANASATWRSNDNRYEWVAYSSNILNHQYATALGVTGTVATGLAYTRFLGPERFYSLQLRMRFQ